MGEWGGDGGIRSARRKKDTDAFTYGVTTGAVRYY
jgi:hypothetical protein